MKSTNKLERRQYQELTNAIIIQAAEDYREALQKLKINPAYKEALWTRAECERFFHSDWYRMLTRVDGTWLQKQLQKE